MVVRTPPAVSLYHRFENPLFARVLDRLRTQAQTVVLPRTPAQRAEVQARGGLIVPERAIDAQSLIALSDLVVSAGGTMNREAVALGTPVFTTFEGRLGAVDSMLLSEGRLRRLTDPGRDQDRKARSARWRPDPAGPRGDGQTAALSATTVTNRITSSVNARRLGQVGVDACLIALAYYLAFVLRFDSGIPDRYQELLQVTVGFVVLLKLSLFAIFGLYSKLWRFVDQADFESIVKAVVVASFVLIAGLFLLPFGVADPPRGVMALDFLITLALVGGARFVVRAVVERPLRQPLVQRADSEVLIVGAGNGGQQVALELRRNPELSSAVIGFVDDDPRKKGMLVAGHRVFGTTDELPRILDDTQPDEVVIAIPSAPGELRLKVVTACRERDIPVRTLPTVFELLSRGPNLLRQVREVKVEDVLGREPVRADTDRVGAYLRDRVVVVTGAGGSIGSELCRQIARVRPRRLVLVDHAENNLFEISRQLEEEHFGSQASVLADCKDATRMGELFAEEKPSVVFHAAAYKHVGLMEQNPVEAVRNNAVATRIVAAAAGEAGVERFVLVSTDKAVAPATVMGASKALAEWAVEAAQNRYRSTRYAAVRFGNVLGSSGSVVPIFRRQIEAGGPGHGHRRRDDALLHDHPRGRAADHPRRRPRAAPCRGPDRRHSADRASPARPDVRAGDGRPGQDRRPGAQHDSPVGQGARRGHRDRDRRPPAGGEDPRGAVRDR